MDLIKKIFKLPKLKKSKPTLIPDVLDEVFRHLIDDRRTLRSCILVNRLWCRLIIPILWSDPFMKRNDYGYFAIRTYICCLDEYEKSLLRKQNIRIPKFSNPLFDYPKFLLIFNYNNFAVALEDFVTGNEVDFLHMNEKRMMISSVIINMIFTRSRGIRRFDYYRSHLSSQIILTLDHSLSLLGTRKEKERETTNTTNTTNTITENESFKINSLSRMQTFKFNGYCIKDEIYSVTWPNLFKTIATYATSVQHLSFHIKRKDFNIQSIYVAIGNLIKAQRTLVSFEINEIWTAQSDKIIFNALCTQSYSLKHVKLNGKIKLSSLMDLLLTCYNLNTLEVKEFYRNDYIPLIKYQGSKLNNITNLSYLQYQPPENPQDNYEILLLLQMISDNLKVFSCKYFCQEIFVNLKKYSINLTNLRIVVKSHTIERFSKVLSLMSSLKYLYLESPKEEYTLFNEDMIHKLSYSLPQSLDHLSFNLSVTQELLKTFLSGCSVPLTTLELFSIYVPNRKVVLYVIELHNRIGTLRTLKLGRLLMEKYNFYLHNRKKMSYKVVETTPDWFHEIQDITTLI